MGVRVGAAAARDFASEAAVGANRPEDAAGVRGRLGLVAPPVGELTELRGMDGVFDRPPEGVFARAGGCWMVGVLERA